MHATATFCVGNGTHISAQICLSSWKCLLDTGDVSFWQCRCANQRFFLLLLQTCRMGQQVMHAGMRGLKDDASLRWRNVTRLAHACTLKKGRDPKSKCLIDPARKTRTVQPGSAIKDILALSHFWYICLAKVSV